MDHSSSRLSRADASNVITVSFGDGSKSSATFETLYRQGMALVEETASYLDGTGRQEAKGLKGTLSLSYATESMRLTTRLMQLASWLLIRKAVRDGEMSNEDALRQRQKVRFTSVGRPGHTKDFELLPARLRSLVERSFALEDRILRLDRIINSAASGLDPDAHAAAASQSAAAEGTVDAQQCQLRAAFSLHHMAASRRRP